MTDGARGAGEVKQGHRLDEPQAIAIADKDPKVKRLRRGKLEPTIDANLKGSRWQVGYFVAGKERVQVLVDEAGGKVAESWAGDQIAWTMARGYSGAFGRKVNAPYVWLPLCAAFFLAFFHWRAPWRLAHLDLAVLLAFGVSHYFFNQGEIGLSVPLAYPPLIYLLGRMLHIGLRRNPSPGATATLTPAVSIAWLLLGLLFLVGFRAGLNIADSNVIDVGYSGVIGADRIADGTTLYGAYPKDNPSGDTYGPAAYYAYVPFEQALPWSGRWDDLPAAHAAAIFFDLLTMLGLFLVGRRLRPGTPGTNLGITLAFAWAAYPYTTFALTSNANDALLAALLTFTFLALTSPIVRGALLALAAATKFAPLALIPLLARVSRRTTTVVAGVGMPGWRTSADRDVEASSTTGLPAPAPNHSTLKFTIAFLATAALVMAQTTIDPGLATFYDRTIGFQAGRGSPFSIWGQVANLEWLQTTLKAATLALAVAVAFHPRQKTPTQTAALVTAILIAVELTLNHWFYLYLVWFFPLLLVALATPVRPTSPASRTLQTSCNVCPT